jgi:hypothetical protein
MVGYMNLHAQTVPRDKITALAWYRLAAERDDPALMQARDELLATMTPAEIAASNRIFLQLWKVNGDTRIIMKLVREDMDTLKARTGSRIPGSTTSGPALIFRPSGEILPPDFYRRIRVRLESRLSYLETKVEISDADVASDDESLRSIDEQARAELAAIGIP